MFFNTKEYLCQKLIVIVAKIIKSFYRPFNSLEALQRAKRVVEETYAVVGVLEDMNATLLAFENYVPRFFKGAKELYWGQYIITFISSNFSTSVLVFCSFLTRRR